MPDAATPEEPPKTVEGQLNALFAHWNRSDAPGVAVGVVKDGVTIYRRGFGMASLEAGAPITPDTKMRIGSTSKHFTALLALLLAEEGRLDIDASIRQYLPELAGPGGDPSIRMLLQHRGGSRCYLDLGFIGHGMAVPPVGRAFEMQMRQQERNFPVGETMIYNNGGYHLCALAMERVGGAPFADQLKQRLFDPVGMPDTALIYSDFAIVPGMATHHIAMPDGSWRRGLFPSEEVSGEGGIVSTINDMLRWAAHLRSRDRFGSEESWCALVAPPLYFDASSGPYALGMMVGRYRGAPVVHHAGGVIGGSSQMISFPEHGLDIVIFANGALGANPTALADKVADVVLADQLGPPTKPTVASTYGALVGNWWSDQTGLVYELKNEKDELKLVICGAPAGLPLEPMSGNLVRMSVGSLADITLDLGAALNTGELFVKFGAKTDLYSKLDDAPIDKDALADRAGGRYRSEDADCIAELDFDGGKPRLWVGDRYGSSTSDLEILGKTVALARKNVGGLPFTASICFDGADGPFTGFRMSTGRTRNLRFERVWTVGSGSEPPRD
jgi:D-aminopeptidase